MNTTLILTKQEVSQLEAILDVALKAAGLQVAQGVMRIHGKLVSAFQDAQTEADGPAPKAE